MHTNPYLGGRHRLIDPFQPLLPPLALLRRIVCCAWLLGMSLATTLHAKELVSLECRDGAPGPGLSVYWGESNTPGVLGYTVRWRLPGEAWEELALPRQPDVVLTSLQAGSSYEIQAFLRLDTGAEEAYSDVSNVRYSPFAVTPASDTLNVNIRSLNIDRFPAVELNVVVSTNGQSVTGLLATAFQVSEIYSNAVGDRAENPLTDISVTASGTGGVRPVDIVFVIDDTGSMEDEIGAVRDNVLQFADTLQARSFDYRLGLVRFKDEDDTVVFNSGNLTADKEVFKGWVRGLVASGGGDVPENAFGAICLAASMNFRPGSQRVFILITDAVSHSRSGVDLAGAIECIRSIGICFVAGPNVAQYNGPGSLSGATGGGWYAVTAGLLPILDRLSVEITEVYTIRYNTVNARFDGESRTVKVQTTHGPRTGNDAVTYLPLSGPQIELDAATQVRLSTAVGENTPIPVGVTIRDLVAPFPVSSTLHYRQSGSGAAFASLSLVLNSGSAADGHYQATIPASVVRRPGVEFYFTSTDGTLNRSLPPEDPDSRAFAIAVTPNEAPVIQHTPPAITEVTIGAPVHLVATVTDTTLFVQSVRVEYRAVNPLVASVPVTLIMTATGGNRYEADIPGTNFTAQSGGVRYFIEATDDSGLRTRAPQTDLFEVLVPDGDADLDGLLNSEELAAGTNPDDKDTDGDSLWDGWEVKGMRRGTEFLDLPALGANPLHKDLFVEIDYLCGVGPGEHCHRPSEAALDRVVRAFATAPVTNPDGVDGVTLHYYIDELIPETADNKQLALWILPGRVYDAEWVALKNAHFPDSLRRHAFRWCLIGHDHATPVGGEAEGAPAGAFLISQGLAPSDQVLAGTFMHELGHTIGLRHGGSDQVNFKPNYLSVMNYFFQNEGLNRDGVSGVLDYSRAVLPPLRESALSELIGIGDSHHHTRLLIGTNRVWLDQFSPPNVDWNRDGDVDDTGLRLSLNGDSDSTDTFDGFNDWANLKFAGANIGDAFGDGIRVPPAIGEPVPEEMPRAQVASTEPPRITGLSATNEPRAIVLRWQPSEDNSLLYRIYRGLTANSLSLLSEGPSPAGSFLDQTAAALTTYYYSVSIVTAFGTEGAPSPIVSAMLLATTFDLRLRPSTEPSVIEGGATFTYTVDLSNAGPHRAERLVLTSQFPPALALGPLPTGCNPSGGSVVCTLDALEAGASATLRFTATAPCAGELAITSAVVADGDELEPANNRAVTGVSVVDRTPPVLACPIDMITEFLTETGSALLYAVPQAEDACAGRLDVTCQPPPGSTFSIGLTVVTCSAVDPADNRASCDFSVTVLGARGVKAAVLRELRALRAVNADPKESAKLDSAIADLDAALSDALWVAENHVQPKEGQRVFNLDKDSVIPLLLELRQAREDASADTYADLIDRIARSDRLLALIGIQNAISAGGDPERIDLAQGQLASGDESVADGKIVPGIEHYRNAWSHALHMKFAKPGRTPAGDFQWKFIGIPNQLYAIQTSTNLIDWVTITTRRADRTGVIELGDGWNQAARSRFYRVTAP